MSKSWLDHRKRLPRFIAGAAGCVAVVLLVSGLGVSPATAMGGKPAGEHQKEVLLRATAVQKAGGKVETATFAGGCFWGIQLAFERLPGVLETKAGYTGGSKDHPAYGEVSTGATGHTEAVEVKFDPDIVSYRDLLRVFFEIHDPTTLNRQGNDVGTQYRSGIYYHSEQQKEEAADEKQKAGKELDCLGEKCEGDTIVTEILPAGPFWDAEGYHQHYLAKGGQSAKKGETANIRCYG